MKRILLSILLSCSPLMYQQAIANTSVQQQSSMAIPFLSEYGFEWKMPQPIDYKNFYLLGIENGQQVALYETRKGKAIAGIQIGHNIQDVKKLHGEPLDVIVENGIRMRQNYTNKYNATTKGIYLINGQYIEYLYDSHDKNRVRAILAVDQKIYENQPKNYLTATQEVRQSFEILMGHLLNQSRVAHNLPPLIIAQQYTLVARQHSEDMVKRDFFAHKNPDGHNPTDRMKKVNPFLGAGENISNGYDNPILSHHGLMNSLGHRENILNTSYTHSLTGVAFSQGEKSRPMYTIKFYTDKSSAPMQLLSEYGFEWQLKTPVDYKNFYLTAVKNHQQVAFYETRPKVSFGDVHIGQNMNDVLKKHGQPLEYIVKNNVRYKQNYQSNNQTTHGTYLINGQYITYIYDPLNKHQVRAILGVNEEVEHDLNGYYAQPSTKLRNGSEQLLVHLINQVRVSQQLKPLLSIEKDQEVARKHSQEMVNLNFYAYENKAGESSAQRLRKANIEFSALGSNVLKGSRNSMDILNRLMMSDNDRKNIFHPEYSHVITGIAFNTGDKPSLVSTTHFYRLNRYNENVAHANGQSFLSGYDFKWVLPNSIDYKNFYLVGMHNNLQVALYETRQGKSVEGISIGQHQADVLKKHGQPVEYILKNNTRYKQSYSSSAGTTHGTYLIKDRYITYLYDTQNNQRIVGITAIDKDMEETMRGFNPQPSASLGESHEHLLVHLINQARAAQQVSPLTDVKTYKKVLRDYSQDMVKRNFYSTQNPDKQNIKQLMQNANIPFTATSQSVLKGSQHAIDIYHDLFNNPNNRKNMLNTEYSKMISGVAFNSGQHPSAVTTIAYYAE